MYLKTTKKVKINEGFTGEKSTVLELHIQRVIITFKDDVEIHYSYFDEEGNSLGVKSTFIEKEITDVLYNMIKNTLPSGLTDSQHQEIKFYSGAKIQMLDVLKEKNPFLTLNDIEIIQEEK